MTKTPKISSPQLANAPKAASYISDASGAGKKNPFAISPIRPVLGAASSHVGRPSLLGGA